MWFGIRSIRILLHLPASKPYRYGKGKQGNIDYYINKLALNDIFMFIDLSFASPVMLCVKNNSKSADDPESYRFAIDYGKLNTTMQHIGMAK